MKTLTINGQETFEPTRIEITTGRNGYPENLKFAFTDFDTFEQAEKFAKEYNGDVVLVQQRAGWQFWEEVDTICFPISVAQAYYNFDIYDKEAVAQEIKELAKMQREGEGDFADIRAMWREYYNSMNDDEVIIYDCANGDILDKVKNNDDVTSFTDYDVMYYKIAVVDSCYE